MSENNAYVYGHYKADTDELFYIGKGIGGRAWETRNRNNYWKNVVNKHGFVVKILYENLSEEDAYTKERELINEIGLENLTNITDGGLGHTSESATRLAKDERWRKNHLEGCKKINKNKEYRKKRLETNRKLAKNPDWLNKVREVYNNPDWCKKHELVNEHRKVEAVLVSPDGEIVHIKGIKSFARMHGWDSSGLWQVIKKRKKSYKGWKLYEPQEEHKISEFL